MRTCSVAVIVRRERAVLPDVVCIGHNLACAWGLYTLSLRSSNRGCQGVGGMIRDKSSASTGQPGIYQGLLFCYSLVRYPSGLFISFCWR